MGNKALCIGINDYPGYEADLAGCVNDADDWAVYLDKKGYATSVLSNKQATKAAIVYAITSLISSLQSGDTGVIQYSGHGTWLPDLNGDEPDRRDEALCPYDVSEDNLILDDELMAMFVARPVGAQLIFITDCCHSGTVHRFSSITKTKRKIRYLPPSHFVRSPALLRHIAASGLPGRTRSVPTNAPLPYVLHMAGCSDNEYSYDAEFAGRPNGAFSYYALQALNSGDITYNALFDKINDHLPSWDHPQTPRLNAVRRMRTAVAFK